MSLKYVLATAALAGATLTSPAWALDLNLGLGINVQVGADIGVTIGDDNTAVDLDLDAVAALDAGAVTDFGAATTATGGEFRVNAQLAAVIDLINDTTVTTGAVFGATAITAIYDITALVNANGAVALDAALTTNAEALANLQLALAANASLAAALQGAGVNLEDVIALGVDASGALIIFVN